MNRKISTPRIVFRGLRSKIELRFGVSDILTVCSSKSRFVWSKLPQFRSSVDVAVDGVSVRIVARVWKV